MAANIRNLTDVIKEFDAGGGIAGHEQLDIEIPSGFFRYHRVEQYSDIQWSPVKVKFVCNYKILSFTVVLAKRGKKELPALEMIYRGGVGKREKWGFAEPLVLSLPQARQLVRFLQSHFGGFDFGLRTKLS